MEKGGREEIKKEERREKREERREKREERRKKREKKRKKRKIFDKPTTSQIFWTSFGNFS